MLVMSLETSNQMFVMTTIGTLDNFDTADTAINYQKIFMLFYKGDSVIRLAKYCHFGKTMQVFGKFLAVIFLFGKMLSLLWQIWYIIGLFFYFCQWPNIEK